jgi:D-sedoheptulose 7-phosphate isomerase
MLGVTLNANDYLTRLNSELERTDREALTRWVDLIHDAWRKGNWVYIFGNDGSGTTASHMAADLGKGLLREGDLADETKRRLKVLSLTDNAGWLMAVGNDLDYDQIYVQQLMNYRGKGDVAIGISGSGNSANVLHAFD